MICIAIKLRKRACWLQGQVEHMKVVVRVRPIVDADRSAWDIEDGTSIRLRADAAVKHKRPFYGLTGASNAVRGSNASLLELGHNGVSRTGTPNSLAGAVQLMKMVRPGAVSGWHQ